VIRVELALLVRRPRTWISLGILIALPVTAAIFLAVTKIAPQPGDTSAPPLLSQVLSNGTLFAAAALAVDLIPLLPLCVLVVAGDSIAGEANSGTLRYLLASPVSRSKLLTAKLVTIIAYVIGAVIIVAIAGYIAGVIMFPSSGSITTVSGGEPLTPSQTGIRIVFAVFYVFFDVSQVSGPSMVPTLLDGDRLLLTKGYTSPRHGDIVVFIIDEQGTPTEIVKRVVGLPGDTIEVLGDNVLVNGKPEATPHPVVIRFESPRIAPQVIPAGTVFVMGDNRPVSLDSRYIGPLPLSTAHGRVAAIWAPIGRMRVVPSGLD